MHVGEKYPSVNLVSLSNAEALIPSILKRFLSCLITEKDESTKIEEILSCRLFPKEFNNAIAIRTCGSFT